MATTSRSRSRTGTSSSTGKTRTRRKRTGTSSAKRSTSNATASNFTGLSQARQIGKKLQNYHVKGLELVNEFVAMLPAQTRQSRGRRASTSSSS